MYHKNNMSTGERFVSHWLLISRRRKGGNSSHCLVARASMSAARRTISSDERPTPSEISKISSRLLPIQPGHCKNSQGHLQEFPKCPWRDLPIPSEDHPHMGRTFPYHNNIFSYVLLASMLLSHPPSTSSLYGQAIARVFPYSKEKIGTKSFSQDAFPYP